MINNSIIFFKILLIAVNLCISFANEPKIKTAKTTYRGTYHLSENGREYESYRGIQYAQPPVGKNRFKSPSPLLEELEGEYNATQLPEECAQFDLNWEFSGIEDCLYLNVYTPAKSNSLKDLPVIFFIHGGGFLGGYSGNYDPKYFMDRNVVLVIPNYRLGVLGFLSTGDAEISGNMGLKDQNLALKWTAKYIRYFGGDPKRITLAGNSAGSASVHYHYLSKMSAGLFQGGILSSGTAVGVWSLGRNPWEVASAVGKILNCPVNNSTILKECLMKQALLPLCKAHTDVFVKLFPKYPHIGIIPYAPVVEKDVKDYFIDKPPRQILREGVCNDVPLLASFVEDEGVIFTKQLMNATRDEFDVLNENWETLAPHILNYASLVPKDLHSSVANQIKHHYLGTQSFGKNVLKNMTKLGGDILIGIAVDKSLRLHDSNNRAPIWLYYYKYDAFNRKGVFHADDIKLIFKGNLEQNREQTEMREKMIDIWYSFARDGKPNMGIEWSKIDSRMENLLFLNIDNSKKFKVISDSNPVDVQFWKKIGFYGLI